jgi:hypothetical protein
MVEWKYISTIFDIISRWEWSASRFGRFTLWETAPGTQWIRRLGGFQGRSGRCGKEKNLTSTGIRNPVFQL